ncbi:hypothetical protein B0H11DRAFT_2246371 [Mycena galericulata]|nr:hypothetical protein B0H11DRAFT_2246371 [Mycena galericulata]
MSLETQWRARTEVLPAAKAFVLREFALDARAPIDPPRCSYQLSCGGVGTDEAD